MERRRWESLGPNIFVSKQSEGMQDKAGGKQDRWQLPSCINSSVPLSHLPAKGTAAHWSELCKQELWERGKPRRTGLSHPFVSRESDDSVKKASHCWSCGIQNL